jgi:hypothetical protein
VGREFGRHSSGARRIHVGFLIVARRALVVGIPATTYRSYLFQALPGADMCAGLVALYLRQAGFDSVTRPEGEGLTAAAVQQSLVDLVGRTGPGDLGVFYFYGHGWQYKDGNHDGDRTPEDDQDEFLVCADSVIIDDWFGKNLWPTARAGATFAIVIDACHSESVASYITLPEPVEVKVRPWNNNVARLILAACHDNENTYAEPGPAGMGIVTKAMLMALNRTPTISYGDLWSYVANAYQDRVHNGSAGPLAVVNETAVPLLAWPAFGPPPPAQASVEASM